MGSSKELQPESSDQTPTVNASSKSKAAVSEVPQSRGARFKAFLRRRWWLLLLALLVLGALGYLAYAEFVKSPTIKPTAVQPKSVAPQPTTAPSPLTGLSVPIDQAHRWPVAAMIENSTDARPQSGLSKAGLVYEAFAEGGITRYMAVFLEGDTAGQIGPIRSARAYYVDWADEIHAIYVHAGGSPGALEMIPSTSVVDMNGLLGGIDTAFTRVSSRAAPHNLYTTLDAVRSKAKANGADLAHPSYPTFIYRNDLKEDQRPESAELSVNWGGSYAVKWVYDKSSNSYTRYLVGKVDTDAASSKPITARNIIIQTVPQSLVTDDPKHRLDIGTIGSGAAKICNEGGCSSGTWKKVDGQKTRFYDSTGNEVRLVRGTTWIEVTPPWVVSG